MLIQKYTKKLTAPGWSNQIYQAYLALLLITLKVIRKEKKYAE